MLATAEPLRRGMQAPDFQLPGIDGRDWSLQQLRGPRGLVLMFVCNHCPYVRAVAERLQRESEALRELGIHSAAINSNDTVAYPEDSFDNMQRFAAAHGWTFPYLFDESQQVARAYGAVCTPDLYGFNAQLQLQYRGRLDSTRGLEPPGPTTRRELFEAMQAIAQTGHGPQQQAPSIGCSIKWRHAD